MSKTYGKINIEETDNGWVVEASYFCHGGEGRKVFLKWDDVIRMISEAMGVEL